MLKNIFISLMSIWLVSCESNKVFIEEIGVREKRTIPLDYFNGVVSEMPGNISIHQGDEFKVVIDADSNVIERYSFNVIDSNVHIGRIDGNYRNIQTDIRVFLPQIDFVNLDNAGDIIVNDFANQQNDLVVISNSSGDITINAMEATESIKVLSASNGKIHFQKNIYSLNMLELNVNSAGDVDAMNVTAENCKVSSTSNGDAYVNVNNLLDVEIKSAGDVFYKGNPEIKSQITSSGKLINVE